MSLGINDDKRGGSINFHNRDTLRKTLIYNPHYFIKTLFLMEMDKMNEL